MKPEAFLRMQRDKMGKRWRKDGTEFGTLQHRFLWSAIRCFGFKHLCLVCFTSCPIASLGARRKHFNKAGYAVKWK